MKIVIGSVLFVYLVYRSSGDSPKYTSKYDEVNLDEILASERLLNGYINCLLDNGPCTPDAKELKRNLPDAIENECKKCTDRQRDGSDKVMHYIIDNKPDDWAKLEKKYNSDGSYKEKYLQRKPTISFKSDSKENTSDEAHDSERK